ncbi:MAG: tetratricopeptide repeat protein [Chloroflexi bacterium]|nr:tetratricopeptide repeat protein [Chloroflexota bacterium]
MFRRRPRRPFRRMIRPLGPGFFGGPLMPGRGLGARPMQLLERANQLMASGEYDEAADIFGQLADAAEEHDMPKRAAHLHLQTARALLELGEPDDALARVKRGLGLFAAIGKTRRVAQLVPRIVEEFRARGFNAQADAVAALTPQALTPQALTLHTLTPQPPLPKGEGERRRGTLPAKCPHCGGAVRSDEVEWIDATSAECDYCGSVVKTE